MEGSCERRPKWQNLKFAEISVWRRVSDLFFHALFCSFCFFFWLLYFLFHSHVGINTRHRARIPLGAC